MKIDAGLFRRALLIGSGYFTVALLEPLYGAYVPLMLSDHLTSSLEVGLALSALNLIAPLVIPVFSSLSDRTVTSIGRRMPYIIVFLPLAALALALVPIGAQLNFFSLITALAVMNFCRHAARGPVVSLMPDLIPSHQRSQANGIINMMGGVAAITATVFLAPLITIQIYIPTIGLTGRILPFWIIAVLIFISTAFLFHNVKEPIHVINNQSRSDREMHLSHQSAPAESSGRVSDSGTIRTIIRLINQGRNGPFPILIAVTLWFTGWKLIIPFITIYARDHFGAGEAAAGLSFGMLAISQTFAAIPTGMIAARFGRRRTIRQALIILSVIGVAIFINHRVAGSTAGFGLYIFWGLLFCLGLTWATLITNCLPLLWDLGGSASIGLFTGLYYFASQTALVGGPGIGGAIIEVTGFGGLFIGFSAVMLLARIFFDSYHPASNERN